MMSYRRLGWSSPRAIAFLVTLGIALFSAATVQAATQFDYSCDACHQMPPLDSDTGAREPATGATKGNHQSHSGATAATCVKCHGSELTSTGHRDKTIQVGGNINGSPKGASASYTRVFFNQTSVPPNPLGTCSDINCHFEKVSPAWGNLPRYQSPADCNQCHLMVLESGSHPGHAGYYGTGTGSCANCHPDHAAKSLPFRHATSAAHRGIAVSFTASPNNGGSYSGDGLNFLPSQGKTSFGDCSNIYCHSNGAGADAPAVWGGTLPADCTGCHGGKAGSGSVIGTGSHGQHIDNVTNLGTNYGCARCHNGTMGAGSDLVVADRASHVDGGRQVAFPDGGGYGDGACSATTCHSAGKGAAPQPPAPVWGGDAMGCTGCHGIGSSYGEPVYPNAGPGQDLANSHGAKHVSGAASCVDCHAATTEDGITIISGATTHTDGDMDVRFPAAHDLGGAAYNGAPGEKTCANTYCHSDGNNGPALVSVKWGGSTNCVSCHGGDAGSGAPVDTYLHRSHLDNAATLGLGQNLKCGECHAQTMGLADNTTITGQESHINRFKDYSGARAGGSAGYGNMVCSNVYCHSTGEAVPVFRNMTGSKAWNGSATLGCDGCHGYGAGEFAPVAGEPHYPSRPGAANSHFTHTVGANMADSRGCAVCHRSTVDQGVKDRLRNYSSAHIDGVRDVSFAVIANYSGHYNKANQSCANTYCHGSGDSAQWGAPGPLSCTSCHAAGAGLAGQHGSHWQGAGSATSYAAAPGNATGTAGSYNFACSSCHNGAHARGPVAANNAAEVFFNYTAKGLKGSYQYGSTTSVNGTLQWSNGTCSGTYCHSDGKGGEGFGTTAMNWNSPQQTLSCNGCHGGDYSKPNPIDSNLHRSHLDPSSNASLGIGNAMRCAACHAQTMSSANDGTLSDKRLHVNKFREYSGLLAGGSGSWDPVQKSCSDIYCHSNGKVGTAVEQYRNPGRWDAAGTLGCNGCHGDAQAAEFPSDALGTPNYVGGPEGSATANSHKLHLEKMGGASSSNVCYVCHARTMDKYAERTFRPYSSTHLSDGSTHVAFGSIAASGFELISSVGKARYQNKTCSTVTCHSDGKGGYQDVKWGARSNCAMCHPLNKLSRGHSFHVYTSAVNTPTFYDNYTANRSTGGATARYNYGCANCHPVNNPNHMKGTVLIDLRPGNANVVGTLRSKNGAAITVGGVVAGTAGSGTSVSGNELFCSNVYCHSNGYPANLVYAPVPGWYNGSFTGDRCANCHGNAPNSTIAGSSSHYNSNWLGSAGATGGHVIGVHANVITNGVNFTGLLSPGTTDPSSHGQTPTVTPTTMSCNTCHYSVITTSANSGSAQCASCHTGAAPTRALADIANKSLHVNGGVSVQFRPTKLFSKAQLNSVNFALISSAHMERVNGYKAATSYDVSKAELSAGSYAGNGGNCTTACHFNKPVRWDNVPAATCNSCHTGP